MKTFEEIADSLWGFIKIGQQYEDLLDLKLLKIVNIKKEYFYIEYSDKTTTIYHINDFARLINMGILKKL